MSKSFNQHNSGPLGEDVWNLAAYHYVYDPRASARESAQRRALLARVSKSWFLRVVSNLVLWTSITVKKDTPLSAIEYNLLMTGEADLHIRLSLVDMRRFYGRPARMLDVGIWIDALLNILGPTSPRWKSFCFETEDPLVFAQVQSRCAPLSAENLEFFDASYTHLYGLFAGSVSHARARPFVPSLWFKGKLPNLQRFTTCCVPMLWRAGHSFASLTSFEYSDLSSPSPLPIDFLPLLFTIATRLRILRLGAMEPFAVPDTYSLVSTSLEVFDIDFETGPTVSHILDALDAPSLVDLTVRDVRTSIHWLLQCPDLLRPLTRFCVYSAIGDPTSLQHLFTGMPNLEVLDLTHSRTRVFDVYCTWATKQLSFGKPLFFLGLRVLHLPAVDLAQLASFLGFVAGLIGTHTARIGVDRVRVERSSNFYPEDDAVSWLRAVVPDFGFTNIYSPPGTTYNFIRSGTAHSLLRLASLPSLTV
ncbi:hypothetical protein C8R47DRAFT_1084766 [Mycena vitilis]|nr:hypothetical protein C8R47DRAFT_1084766 [Mycena vitilis]